MSPFSNAPSTFSTSEAYIHGCPPRTRVSRGGHYETSITVAGRNPYWFSVNEDIVTRGRILNPLDMDEMHFCSLIDQEMLEFLKVTAEIAAL